MKNPRWLCFTCALTLALVTGNAMSEVYRWTDSQGKVHFGDRHDGVNPQTVQEVVVPRPNVVSGFKGTPTAPATTPPSGPETATPPAPMTAPKADPRGVAAQAGQSCKAKVEAYRASKACFDACGRNNGNLNGRNNAGCERCVDLPMPNC